MNRAVDARTTPNHLVVLPVSDYNDVYFPELIEHKDRILEIVQHCFDGFKDKCPVEPPEYSIDIAVDLTHERAYVIELNPCVFRDNQTPSRSILNPCVFRDNERRRALLCLNLPVCDPIWAVCGPRR